MTVSDERMDIGLLVLGYSRPELFEKAARSLRNLALPPTTPVYGVIDGPRKQSGPGYEANCAVQDVANALVEEGVLSHLTKRERNLGTMQNVFVSVTEVLKRHEYIFVLEDDLEVLPVARGVVPPLVAQLNESVIAFGIYCNRSFVRRMFLSHRFSSQAWGTSRAAWNGFSVERIKSLELTRKQRRLLGDLLGGDMLRSFRAFQHGKLDSWAVPWNVYNFLEGGVMVYTPYSYVENNSHLEGAERTFGIEYDYEIADRPFSELDSCEPTVNQEYLKHFKLVPRINRRVRAVLQKIA